MNTPSLANDEILPFPTYRTPRPEHDLRFEAMSPELVPSIEHFFQSERFRGTDEGLRLAVLEAVTARQARKLATRHASSERPDWSSVCERVMEAAVWMKIRHYPQYARLLVRQPELAEFAYSFRDHFWGNHRSGVSQHRYKDCLLHVRDRLVSQRTMRVAITGSSTFSNPFLMETTLERLFRRSTPDVILIGCRAGADDLAEHWAIRHAVPVRHLPYKNRRSSADRRRHTHALLRLATHLVVFDDSDRDLTELVSLAKQTGCALRVISSTARVPATAPPAPSERGSVVQAVRSPKR